MNGFYQEFDFFIDKIPPFRQFELEYHSFFYVVVNHKTDRYYPEINPAATIATIGLIVYFEAFWKHQFAAIVNILPDLIPSFAAKRGEPKLDFPSILAFKGEFEKNIGFVLAQQYDFGTVKIY